MDARLHALVSTHHTAYLGKTGSGKSNAAKVMVETQLLRKERVCIVDPTGAWWGLRLKADGSPSPFPIVIFGGHHADVPITGDHGAVVADVVAGSSTPAIIDTLLMTVGERTRFFTDFAETLLRKNKGPLNLVLDEAHVFAPQGKVPDPQAGKMLHAANNLVALGRSRGLRISLITQRPAKLHKDSLTQVETMIALRVIAPQDRAAIEAWIGEWAGKGEGKDIIASLPSLPTGDAWIWSPEAGILERYHFPLASTFDSGKPLEDMPELAPIDLASVHAMLGAAAEELEADDPKKLKARIAELERDRSASNPVDIGRLEASREEVNRLREEVTDLRARLTGAETKLLKIASIIDTRYAALKDTHEDEQPPAEQLVAHMGAGGRSLVGKSEPFPRHVRGQTVEEAYLVPEKPKKEGNGELNAAALDLAAVLTGQVRSTAWDSLLVMGGYRPGSGWIRKSKNELVENGLIHVDGAYVQPTDKLMADERIAPRRAPTPAELRALWKEKLRGPGGVLAEWLAKNGPATRKEVAEGCGFSPAAGWTRKGFKDLLGSNLARDAGDQLHPHPLLVD